VAHEIDEAAEAFAGVRPRLFGIAYRMLGSVEEAEDVVQDTWIRWQRCDRSEVRSAVAFLTTTTTRLAINVATSAHARHETYVGPWLPEPVDTGADPQLGAERGAVLEFAVLMLLEKLTPPQRAAYVLREAFDYPYGQIAEILGTTEASTRQLVSRARKHLVTDQRAPVGAEEQRRLLGAFLVAARTGDLAVLEGLFAQDVVSLADGGGRRGASRIPVRGRATVAKYVRTFRDRFWAGVDIDFIEANGQPSALLSRDGTAFAMVTATASADGIEQLLWVMNPAKLAGVAPVDATRR
jgi:RNA polymerase sigma-70 factor (TIGR02957 family)